MTADVADPFDELTREARACRARGELAPAVALLRQACELRPDAVPPRLELAQALLQTGAAREARSSFAAILNVDPTNGAAIAGLAAAERRLGDHAAAARYFRAAIELQPDHPGLYVELAGELRELGKLDDAERMCRAVLNASPQEMLAFVGLGLVARRRGDHEDALKYMHCAYLLQPDHEGVQGELASTLLQLGRLDEAELVYRRALEARPQSPGALAALSHIALLRGKPDEALAHLQAAIALDPVNADLPLRLAALEREHGRAAEAEAIVARVLQSQPEHAAAWFEQGQLARARNDRAAALAAFRQAAKLGQRRAWIEAAAEHMALGQPAQARAAYQHVLLEAPGDFDARYGVAELQMTAADYAACAQSCDELIASFPAHPAPYRLKCLALLQLDRGDDAWQLASALPTQGPEAARADALRLEVLRACGRRMEALALLAEPRLAHAFSLWTESVQARLAFADYAGAGAALANAPATSSFERSRVHYLEGVLADLQWRIADGIAAFERVLELHAIDTGAHEFLARFHFLQADAAGATRHLERYLAQSGAAIVLRGASRNPSQTFLGLLLNELRLDAPLLVRLHEAASLGAQDRVPVLMDVVRERPGLTPPAMYLLLALRQAGELAAPQADSDSAQASAGASALGRLFRTLRSPSKPKMPAIPRRIVQYWDDGQPPEPVARALDSWRQAQPDHEYVRFDRGRAREYIARHGARAALTAFLRAADATQACDIFRLTYLAREGGIYVGHELRCVAPLAGWIHEGPQLVCAQEPHANLGTTLLACVAGEPVIARALEEAAAALARGDYSDNLWLSTGPGLLTRAFAHELVRAGAGWRDFLRARRVLDRGELAALGCPYPLPPRKPAAPALSRPAVRG